MDQNSLVMVLEGLRNLGIIQSPINESGEEHLKFSCIMAKYRHEFGRDRSPSMTASIDPQGPSYLKCFACRYKRPLITALADLNALTEGAVLSILDWAREVEEKQKKIKSPGQKQKKKRIKVYNYNDDLAWYFRQGMPQEGRDFLEAKGVPYQVARWLKISWIEKATRYRKDGTPYEVSKAILIPILSKIGGQTTCVGAQYRPIYQKGKRAKYGTFFGFSSSAFLFGEHLLTPEIVGHQRLFVLEGPFDAAHLHSLGERAVALIGLYCGRSKAEKIRLSMPRIIYVLLDADAEGQRATTRVVQDLAATGIPTVNLIPPRDPKELSRQDFQSLESFGS